VIATDAPVDNMGKGEAFSPSDLVCSALGSCMLTIMGIVCKRHNIALEGAKVEVIKEMVTAPVRRIGTVTLTFHMPKGLEHKERKMLEEAAYTCPVHKSLHPDVQVITHFQYPD
jgi:putative redox protein